MRRTMWAALIAMLLPACSALAENFPSHPITIIVPFSAGGPSDAMMRILAERMKMTLGETLLTVRRPLWRGEITGWCACPSSDTFGGRVLPGCRAPDGRAGSRRVLVPGRTAGRWCAATA